MYLLRLCVFFELSLREICINGVRYISNYMEKTLEDRNEKIDN
jgi:hypothetical protein